MTISKFASAAFALLAGVAACTGGTAPTNLPEPSPRDPAPNDRDLFAGPDDPGASRDIPPSDRDGVPGSTGGACPACDITYACTAEDGSSTVHITVDTKSTEGGCALVNQAATLTCDGRITPTGGGPSLTWQPYGNGGFTTSSTTTSVTCVPGVATAPGIPTPGGGSSSGFADASK